jgi:galactose oxidase
MSYARVFKDETSQFVADLYNPATNTWRALAAAQVSRNYHSTALLLADGTVFTGGGGLCWTQQGRATDHCDRKVDHPSIEVFSPPYLFNADGTYATRPVIAAAATTTDGNGARAKAGDTVTVRMGDASAMVTFALMRTGSVTHTVNTDQRRVPLAATQNGNTWTMRLPSDYGILLPGYYWLFALNSAGVPSYGRTIQVV